MGGEFGQVKEWTHEESLEWHVLQYPVHQGVQRWLKDLNHFYRAEPAIRELDFSPEGFEWMDFHDWENSVISFVRKGKKTDDIILVVCNFTPIPKLNYHVGVPRNGWWREVLNSDANEYGGKGYGNLGGVEAAAIEAHGKNQSLFLTLPPLGILFFKNSVS
jgi:1,4-alpha-glucan branching enzyme